MKKSNKTEPKILMQIIASILTIIIVFQIFTPVVLGTQETNDLQDEEINETENSSEQTQIIGELTEKRTLNQKYFLQKDGTILTGIYPTAVHYEENGKLVDIDNSLENINDEEEMLQNKKNSFKVKFSKKSNKNNLVKLKILL